jgi:hypothetical protein
VFPVIHLQHAFAEKGHDCVCLCIIFLDGEVVDYLYKNFNRKSWHGAGGGHAPDKSGSLCQSDTAYIYFVYLAIISFSSYGMFLYSIL